MNFTNYKEIRCFGLRRSGNHAIINWIIKQNNNPFVFLNNIKVDRDINPYKSFSKAQISGINPLVYHQNLIKYRRFIKFLLNPKCEYFYGRERAELNRKNLRNYEGKSLLIYSYEHYPLSKIVSEQFEKNRENFLGKSEFKFDVLILRDPYNTFSSLIKKGEKLHSLDSVVNIWIENAKEYLGLSNYLKNKVTINYNNWFKNKDYRQKICEQLGLVFTDAGIEVVPNFGNGSSFDKINYNHKASSMGVLNRYKAFMDHPIMIKIRANSELNELSEEIFGSLL